MPSLVHVLGGQVRMVPWTVLTAPWILSVLYLRTERGRAARGEYLATRGESRGHNRERPE